MTDRKKSGVAFWASVVLVAVMAYPLSFGPVCWAGIRYKWSGRTITAAYQPAIRAWVRAPATVSRIGTWYFVKWTNGRATVDPCRYRIRFLHELMIDRASR